MDARRERPAGPRNCYILDGPSSPVSVCLVDARLRLPYVGRVGLLRVERSWARLGIGLSLIHI
eukprot:13101405-Alexandrium_andersonii.AAC.1